MYKKAIIVIVICLIASLSFSSFAFSKERDEICECCDQGETLAEAIQSELKSTFAGETDFLNIPRDPNLPGVVSSGDITLTQDTPPEAPKVEGPGQNYIPR